MAIMAAVAETGVRPVLSKPTLSRPAVRREMVDSRALELDELLHEMEAKNGAVRPSRMAAIDAWMRTDRQTDAF